MLRLIIGKAGTGKTTAVMNEICEAVKSCEGGKMLIVPEQYSHEAERELCRVCGDSLSLYAEVFSFTGLARRIMTRQGGGAAPYLDKGGRLLCMVLALKSIGSRLRLYGAAARKAELQAMLLSQIDELKTACITPDMLSKAAVKCGGTLGDKLEDLALISEAYSAVAANGHADPADRLSVLARQIEQSDIGPDSAVYVDGFIDFTGQEQEVLLSLLKKGAKLTVCLTVDDLSGNNEIYELSRIAGRYLIDSAKELGQEVEVLCLDSSRDKALRFFADNMFSYSETSYGEKTEALELYCVGSISEECELAASKALELVRTRGCRWRDIAIAVRGFDDYRATLESVFRHYEVPLYVSRRSEMLSKPLPAMISGLYEIIGGGWDVDDVISYMRTGLSGLEQDECDRLENYIFKWQLKASAWKRRGAWKQHPEGYGAEYTEETEEKLREINELRRKLSKPIMSFEKKTEDADTAEQQAKALSEFFEELGLPELLEKRSEELCQAGRETLADEYAQLWKIIVSALEQCCAVLGESECDRDSFGRLFTLMLSKYDVGTIPVSLDSVSAGDFDRMRRRNIKYLIVLGASDNRLPRASEENGMFSEDERRRLLEMDIDLGGTGDSELWREFSLIYNCLTLPSEKLIISYSLTDAEGAEQRPAFVMNRAGAIFGIEPKRGDMADIRMSAAAPAMTLAAAAMRGGRGRAQAAADYLMKEKPERYASLLAAAEMNRGRLSPAAVEALYGKKLRLSASRIDKFASCRFAYFCQYGLRAKPYEPAGFAPPEIGTFMHFVLEGTAREVKARGGFGKVTNEELGRISDRLVEEYVSSELNGFQEKSQRFIYLFKRLCKDVHQIVLDMAQELRRSDFEPIDFELDFSKAQELPPVELGEGEGALTLSGIADRVDGWYHDGKLYLRVVDYKTGKKKFSLSDVCNGMGLQMLLYLFALEESGSRRYGAETVPAGVMYVPARNEMLSMPHDPNETEESKKRGEEIRRSGLVLDNKALIEAWERGEGKQYIPVKFNKDNMPTDGVASLERMGLLSRHIKEKLTQMASELRRGSIAADPFYRSQHENACLNCDYYDACHFSDGQNGEKCRYMPKMSSEKVWSIIEGGGEHE